MHRFIAVMRKYSRVFIPANSGFADEGQICIVIAEI